MPEYPTNPLLSDLNFSRILYRRRSIKDWRYVEQCYYVIKDWMNSLGYDASFPDGQRLDQFNLSHFQISFKKRDNQNSSACEPFLIPMDVWFKLFRNRKLVKFLES